MKICSFIIIIDKINNLKNKINNLNNMNDIEFIFIGNKKYEDKIKKICKNYKFIEEGTNIEEQIFKELNNLTSKYFNVSYLSQNISKKTIKELNKILNNQTHNIYFSKLLEKYDNQIIEINKYNYKICSDINNFFFYKNNMNIKNSKFYLEILHEILLKDNKLYIKKIDKKTHISYDFNNITSYQILIETIKQQNFYYIKYSTLDFILKLITKNLNKTVRLSEETNKEYLYLIEEILNNIDDEIIYDYCKENSISEKNIFSLKYNLKKSCYKLENNGCININNLNIQFPEEIMINAINNTKNKLFFDIAYDGQIFIEKGAKIKCYLNNQKINYNLNEIYSKDILFDRDINKKTTFTLEINKNEINNLSKLEFYYEYKNIKTQLKIRFNEETPQVHLTNLFKHSYWKYNKNKIISYNNTSIFFKNTNILKNIFQELLLYKDFILESQKKILGIEALILRIIYRVTKPLFNKKRIWITFDKLYKAGDNGEYFYKYCKDNKDNIDCYYIINKSSNDYQRLKKGKNILIYKTLKEYLTVLNSECIFTTHAKVYSFCAFTKGKEKYFRDLLNQEIFCIQHGLTIQDIAHIQNRVYDNTKLYFCASELEIKNLEQQEYDYKKYNYIKRTGLARYDGLIDDSKKQILITPTWRNNVANTETNTGNVRPYFKNFKQTTYFKIYNKLINDPKLIKYAKENNYKIIYLLHPTLSNQKQDFDKNNYTEIYNITEDINYEKLLTESSLMITDYSGVQFDFAYMQKPIIYYQPKELPPHYDNKSMDYKNQGFGIIIEDYDKLIEQICKYIKNDCLNDKKYIKRAEEFFIFNDRNNCKRIYKEAINYMEEIK